MSSEVVFRGSGSEYLLYPSVSLFPIGMWVWGPTCTTDRRGEVGNRNRKDRINGRPTR